MAICLNQNALTLSDIQYMAFKSETWHAPEQKKECEYQKKPSYLVHTPFLYLSG